jgi:hypothetical protein
VTILSVVSNDDYPEMRRLAFTVTKERAALFAKGAYELPEWVPGGFVTIEDPNDPLQVVAILAPFLGWLCPEVEWGIVYERRFTDVHYQIGFSHGAFNVRRNTSSRNMPYNHQTLKTDLFVVLTNICRKQEKAGLNLLDQDKLYKEFDVDKKSVQIVRLEEK